MRQITDMDMVRAAERRLVAHLMETPHTAASIDAAIAEIDDQMAYVEARYAEAMAYWADYRGGATPSLWGAGRSAGAYHADNLATAAYDRQAAARGEREASAARDRALIRLRMSREALERTVPQVTYDAVADELLGRLNFYRARLGLPPQTLEQVSI